MTNEDVLRAAVRVAETALVNTSTGQRDDLEAAMGAMLAYIAIRQTHPAPMVTEWQDIATAPKDDPVLAYIPDYGGDPIIMVIEWNEYHNKWQEIDCNDVEPTLWQPIPEGPLR